MKKFLLGLLFCFCVSAQVSDVEVLRNLQNEIISENSKSSEDLQKILERYFNDGCKVTVNKEEIILKKDLFSQYANIGSVFLSKMKKDCELEFPKNDLSDDSKNDKKGDSNKKLGLGVFLNISKKQRVKIDFILKDEKLSEVTLKDVPLNRSQSLMLRGIFNLLK